MDGSEPGFGRMLVAGKPGAMELLGLPPGAYEDTAVGSQDRTAGSQNTANSWLLLRRTFVPPARMLAAQLSIVETQVAGLLGVEVGARARQPRDAPISRENRWVVSLLCAQQFRRESGARRAIHGGT